MTYSIKNADERRDVVRPDLAVVAIDGSPTGSGKTRTALEAVIAATGLAAETIGLAEPHGTERALDALDVADAVVLGAPVYRAQAAAPLKDLLDLVPRDLDRRSALRAKPVAIVHTGASLHHFLALDPLRSVLAGFFAAYVVPPGLYVPREAYDDGGGLRDPYAEHARRQGEALIALAAALAASPALRKVEPQA